MNWIHFKWSLHWWTKGWGNSFPYSCEDIIRNSHASGIIALILHPSKATTIPTPHGLLPPYYFKWNIDASVKDTSINSTIGGVLRDDKGDFICLFFSTYTPMEINNAEVFAILRAIQIILSNTNRLSSQNFIIESYSFNVVTRCNTPSNGPWNLKFQLNFIRNVLNNCPSFSIIHHVRSSSHVADVLPKQGLRWQDEFFAWIWTDQSFLLPL